MIILPGFQYRKIALYLAEAQLTSRKAVLDKYNLSGNTYDMWVQRLKTDSTLKRAYDRYLRKMTESWATEATQTLKKAMEVACLGLENNPFKDKPTKDQAKEIWGKNMCAMSNILKTMGDLNVSTFVLMEEDYEESEEEFEDE